MTTPIDTKKTTEVLDMVVTRLRAKFHRHTMRRLGRSLETEKINKHSNIV